MDYETQNKQISKSNKRLPGDIESKSFLTGTWYVAQW